MARKRSHWKIDDKEESFAEEEETSQSNVPAAAPGFDLLTVETSANEPSLEALRKAYGDLTAKLHSPLLLEHLFSSKLLTDAEYETAKSKESSYDKNTEVLSAMRRRTQKEIVQFCQLLFTCNQSNCGRILLAALTNHGVDVSSIVQPSPEPPVIRSPSPKYYLEMRDLKSRFITLVREVKEVGEQVDDLKTICIELLNDVTSTKHNVQEDIRDLMKCSDGDYIAYLQLHWDHLDCDLLFQLIRQLQKPKLMEDWDSYKMEVKEACKATLAEARRSLPKRRELPVHQISAGFQTDQPSHDVTIQKILDLRDFLKKMMGLEESDFEGFDNVDVTLFYTVNRTRLPFLVRLFALHRRSLQEFSITVVFVPGEFIYNVTSDQEFAYPKLVSQAEASYQVKKDLKEEMLHQFQELKSSKLIEEEAKTQQLQNEAISLGFKLKGEEMLRKKVEEDRARLTEELLNMQTEKKELVAKMDQFTIKYEKLTEELLSLQSMTSKKESVMSSVLPEKMMSEVGTLLKQESSSLEGLQDKLKILLEDWSNKTELVSQAEASYQMKDLKEEMLQQFQELKSSKSGEVEALTSENSKLQNLLKEEQKKGESLQNRVDSLLQQAAQDRDVDSQPVARDLPSSPPTTQGESTSAVSTGDEKLQKIKEIVKFYRNNEEVHLPCVPHLEDNFDDIMVTLRSNLLSANYETFDRLHSKIRIKYHRYIHGVSTAPLSDVPNTPGGLIDFIVEKSNPWEILLVHHAVDELKCEDLKAALEKYEDKLAKHLESMLLSFKSRGVVLASRKDYTHMAIALRLTPDLVLLSLVLHIKEYLVKMLHLEEALFEGFAEGCTILFFSILTTDAVLLSPKSIFHLSELKRKFEITHLVVFGFFACDLEQASVEVLSEGDGLRLELKEAEEKSEQLQYELAAAKDQVPVGGLTCETKCLSGLNMLPPANLSEKGLFGA